MIRVDVLEPDTIEDALGAVEPAGHVIGVVVDLPGSRASGLGAPLAIKVGQRDRDVRQN